MCEVDGVLKNYEGSEGCQGQSAVFILVLGCERDISERKGMCQRTVKYIVFLPVTKFGKSKIILVTPLRKLLGVEQRA